MSAYFSGWGTQQHHLYMYLQTKLWNELIKEIPAYHVSLSELQLLLHVTSFHIFTVICNK